MRRLEVIRRPYGPTRPPKMAAGLPPTCRLWASWPLRARRCCRPWRDRCLHERRSPCRAWCLPCCWPTGRGWELAGRLAGNHAAWTGVEGRRDRRYRAWDPHGRRIPPKASQAGRLVGPRRDGRTARDRGGRDLKAGILPFRAGTAGSQAARRPDEEAASRAGILAGDRGGWADVGGPAAVAAAAAAWAAWARGRSCAARDRAGRHPSAAAQT